MRSISFQRLHAENFKCYTDVSIDFSRFGPGCHSIRGVNKVTPRLGSNGAGKSTLWDALLFALYGKTAKKLRAGDVVPYGTQHNPKVTLDFTVDGMPYQIERRAWPHSLHLATGPSKAIAGAQEHIEQLIGMDMDMFMHTVILAQGQPLFLDLQPRDKLALLSDVLNLNRFEDYSTKAKNRVGTIKLEDHTLQIARSTVEGQLAEIERSIDELQAKADAFADQQAEDLGTYTQRLDEAESALGALEATLMAAKADRDAAELEANDAYRELARAEAQYHQGNSLRIRVGRMTIGSNCPQCGQPVTKAAHQHLSEQAELLIETSDYAKLKAKHQSLKDEATVANREHDEVMRKERRAAAAVEAARVGLEAVRKRDNPFVEPGSVLAQRRHHLETRAKEIDHRRDALEQERQTVEPWVDGFKNIRLMVLDDALATLSVLTTSYANELGLPCDVQFGIERTTKAGTVVSGVHMTVDAIEKIEAWSGGEAQRLRLAASLALSATLLVETGTNIDLLALDEPSAHLSAEGLDELTQFLTAHAEAEGRRIFIVDQRSLNVDNTYTLTRDADNVVLSR